MEELEDSVNDVSHFNTIHATVVGKLKSLEDINEEILSSIDEEEMENEMVEMEDYLLEIRLRIGDLESKHRATVEAIHSSSLNLDHPVTRHSSRESYGNRNNSTSGNDVSNTSIQSTSTSQFHKLPKLTLPTLSGVILEWQTFWDCYESSIDNNMSLSEVQKFFYLKFLLTDEAASVIEGLPVTHGNYLEAIDSLKERFGQTHKIVNAYMQALLDLPRPTSHVSSLRSFDHFKRSWKPIFVVFSPSVKVRNRSGTFLYQSYSRNYLQRLSEI